MNTVTDIHKRRRSVSPHFSVRETGEVLGLLELPCEVALIVEAAEMRDLLNGLIREAQEFFSVIDP